MDAAQERNRRPATAARIWDYILGGVHNFPADQEAARKVIAEVPPIPAIARANRAVLARMVSYLVASGVRQFLDIGSGMPTESNVHEVAQVLAPDARVIYLDIDPVAVSESLEILDGNTSATAVYGDLRAPQAIRASSCRTFHSCRQRLGRPQRPRPCLPRGGCAYLPRYSLG